MVKEVRTIEGIEVATALRQARQAELRIEMYGGTEILMRNVSHKMKADLAKWGQTSKVHCDKRGDHQAE